MSPPLLSICIPSYNRPKEIGRLLKSIDYFEPDIEVIICEDKSPKRQEIASVVSQFSQQSTVTIHYYENEVNLGYDKNLREVLSRAVGEYIVFMGDDDIFVVGALRNYRQFLLGHRELGYVLKTHILVHPNKQEELFKYYSETTYFPASVNTYIELFRRSVFISGFIIKRAYCLEYMTEKFDGTLLYQLWWLANITMKYPSAYCDIPLTLQYKEGTPFFGTAETERALYTPGTVTIDNSINFMTGFFKISAEVDEKYQVSSTPILKKEFSKYAYPILSIQRKKGIKEFLKYHKRLSHLGINNSFYYYIYLIALVFFGESMCDKVIMLIKKILGKTPKL